jgi:hypothetical protein
MTFKKHCLSELPTRVIQAKFSQKGVKLPAFGEKWSDAELIRVLCAYYSLNYGVTGKARLAELEQIANVMPGRTPGSISLRLGNFVAMDPVAARLGKKGMVGGGEPARRTWLRFVDEDGNLDPRKLAMAAVLYL